MTRLPSVRVGLVDAILFAVVITVALAILFDFTNGFHDAANATSTVIATRSLTPKQAVWMSAVFNFLPAFIVGTAVANTISKTVDISDSKFAGGPIALQRGMSTEAGKPIDKGVIKFRKVAVKPL